MEHEVTFSFTRDFIRNGLKRDYLAKYARALGGYSVIVISLALPFTGFDFSLTLQIWGLWFLFGLLAVTVIFWWVFRKAVDRTLAIWTTQSPKQTITFRFEDSGFSIEMENAKSRYEWATLRRVWRYPDAWLLEVVKNASVLFPPAEASEETRSFIVERCRANNVRV